MICQPYLLKVRADIRDKHIIFVIFYKSNIRWHIFCRYNSTSIFDHVVRRDIFTNRNL